MKKVLYVPLDDRPVNLDDVIIQGQSAGIKVITPDRKHLRNRLDSSMTAEGTRVTSTYDPSFGDQGRIRNFMMKHASEVDGFIISIDMLVYGGLIGSRRLRSSSGEPYPSYDPSTLYLLEVITEIKQRYPQKPLYVMDTIMRLATTVHVEGLTMDAYQESRGLMLKERQTATDFEDILSSYDNKPDGSGFEDTIHFNKEQYYNARRHKFKTNRYVLEQLAKSGMIDFLAIGVDDAYVEGAQVNEINWVEGKINDWLDGNQGQNPDKVIILPDADGLGHALLARMVTELYGVHTSLKYGVTYFGPHGSTIINPYEYMSVHENIVRHIEIAGGVFTSEDDYDLHLLAITDEKETPRVIKTMEANMERRIPTLVVDFTGGGAANETVTRELLASRVTGQLLGYSGWNTAGNKLGIAIGMAQARYICLTMETSTATLHASIDAHGSLLFKRFLKDYYYKKLAIAVIRNESNQRSIYTNITAHQNLQLFHSNHEYMLFTAMLCDEMAQATASLASQPAFSINAINPVYQVWQIDNNSWKYAPYKGVELEKLNPQFTWGRAFEITLQPKVTFGEVN